MGCPFTVHYPAEVVLYSFRSPACWICPVGRRGCTSSSAASVCTRACNRGWATPTGSGWLCSPPTPCLMGRAGDSQTWPATPCPRGAAPVYLRARGQPARLRDHHPARPRRPWL